MKPLPSITNPASLLVVFFLVVFYLSAFCTTTTEAAKLGGEKAFFQIPQMTPNVTYRQSFCDRYDAFRNGTTELRDSLMGMKINVGMAHYPDSFFNYDENGIDKDYPGLMAVILDELGRRAGFTWRNSFGLTTLPGGGTSFREILLWSIDTYDLHAEWWEQNIERINLGVQFTTSWYDASKILITKKSLEDPGPDISFWSWTRPYDPTVWFVTLFTVVLSGLVYQILEWFSDERDDRSMCEWWQENAYMSAINITQAYEYQPKNSPNRIFGISMAIFGLFMTATYTANLAALLVDSKPPPVHAGTFDEIAVHGDTICTWDGTADDDYVRANHPKVKRIPKSTLWEKFDGLRKGHCDYAVATVGTWNRVKSIKEYNPSCDLYWPDDGQKAIESYAGFVSKVDAGRECTGFMRDVLNLHMEEMIADGFLAGAWEKEYRRSETINCDIYDPEQEENNNSRQLRYHANDNPPNQFHNKRHLKGARGAVGGAVAAQGSDDGESSRLTMSHMIGTFAIHWFLMAVALVLASCNAIYDKYGRKKAASPGNATVDSTPSSNSIDDEIGLSQRREQQSEEEKKPDSALRLGDMKAQLDQIQSHAKQSQTEMQQTVNDLLQEQRELKSQLQALLNQQKEQPTSIHHTSSIVPEPQETFLPEGNDDDVNDESHCGTDCGTEAGSHLKKFTSLGSGLW